MVRSAYSPSHFPQTHHYSHNPVRLEQVELSASGYIDAGAAGQRINSESIDMKSELFSRLKRSSMRSNKKKFLSVVS
jgi:hypothetical protein